MVTNEELGEKVLPLMLDYQNSLIDYQKNLTTLFKHPELLKPLFGKKKKK